MERAKETRMSEQALEVQTQDGVIDGFFYPPPSGKGPGVIHFTDIIGIRPANRALAQRLAADGYAVFLPNVFYRSGRPPLFDFPVVFGEERTNKRFGELVKPLSQDAIARDAVALTDFVASSPAVSSPRLGVVGYCFTGSMALRYAAACPDRIAATASFHGGGLFNDQPTSPHLVLPQVKARLYFGHAVEDRSMSAAAIEKLEEALSAWGGKFESETYADARHGWTSADSSIYNPTQAERAYAKLKELFDGTLR
jgi:carboxymethylenebutenolidase